MDIPKELFLKAFIKDDTYQADPLGSNHQGERDGAFALCLSDPYLFVAEVSGVAFEVECHLAVLWSLDPVEQPYELLGTQ